MSQKINLNDIIDGLIALNGCSRNTAELFLKELFAIIPEMIQQKKVEIQGIGSFSKDKNGNSNVIIYNTDKALLEILNQPFSCFEPIELDDLVSDEIFDEEMLSFEKDDDKTTSNENVAECDCQENSEQEEHEEFSQPNTLEISENNQVCAGVEEQKSDVSESIIPEKDNASSEKSSTLDDSRVDDENIAESQEEPTNNYEESKYSQSPRSIKMFGLLIFILGLVLGFSAGYIAKDIIINYGIGKIQSQIDTIVQAQSNKNIQSEVDSIHTIEVNEDTIPHNQIEPIDSSLSPVTDKISKARFLTTMARQHYGNLHFWVYIYEENKSKLGHPDKIKPGTIVVIPPISKYDINPNDEESINKAKAKSKEIYAKYTKKT